MNPPDPSPRARAPVHPSIRPQGRIERLARRLLAAPTNPSPALHALHTFALFTAKQAWVCLFGGLMLALLLATHRWYPASAALPRYDLLTLCAIAIQAAFIRLKLEDWDEVRVILLFHIAGTCMELFKTAHGAWSYPEFCYLHLGRVPVSSGFMYASVGSYLARAIRGFDQRFTHHPPLWATLTLSAAIYGNFFLDHYGHDLRYLLMALVALAFARCRVYYRIDRRYRRMPALLGLFLVAFFIWLAENIATFSHTWLYPNQQTGWQMVPLQKLGSWFLLVVMSYVLVTLVNRPQSPPNELTAHPKSLST